MVYKKIAIYFLAIVIIIIFSYTYFSSNRTNFIISTDKDFENNSFINKDKGCGTKANEKGLRKKISHVVIEKVNNIKLSNGIFECSNKSLFFINDSQNILISNIDASKGSDNIFQSDNSSVILEDSKISFNKNNKCIEADNGILILIDNIIENCTIGLEIESSISNEEPVIIILLDNTFRKINRDIIWCFDNGNPKKSNIFLFKKNNDLNEKAYEGKKNICKNIIDIDFELEKAIKKYDFKNLKNILKKRINDFQST